MPEGPEIYKMRDLFEPGHIVIKPMSKVAKYQTAISGKLHKAVARGKHIYLYIGNRILLIQPLMRGIIFRKPNTAPPYDVAVLTHQAIIAARYILFTIVNNNRELYVADPMKNMRVLFVNAESQLGPDCMSPQPNDVDIIYTSIRRRRVELARTMLDQTLFAGCGNYLRAETLYVTKIPALIKCPDVSRKQVELLWKTLTNIAAQIYAGKYKLQIYKKIKTPRGEIIKQTILNKRKLYHV